MAKKASLANVVWALPWILKVLLVIFLDCVYGICRFVDGILQGDLIKIVIGFLWIFYGLGIGWLLDIICVLIGKRPFFF